jgi:kynureninase
MDAASLDVADALSAYRARFVGAEDPGILYLDGNSLGRPVRDLPARLTDFVERAWGDRLIRSWDEGWFEQPQTLGDRLGRVVLGAAAGQTIVGESTTVSLYKLIRAALAAQPGRRTIVVDRANFPTDRYVVQGIAAECGASVAWLDPSPESGVTVDDVRAVLTDDTAVVVLSHVAYRSGYVADVPAITAAAHEGGALVVWDLCHSAGSIPIELDAWGVDLATGCTYKYLNGGPGSPAFLYVRSELIERASQPIQGWMGARDPFVMGPDYAPADGIRRFVSGTPPVFAMLPMEAMLDLVEEAGIDAIRAKSLALTSLAIELFDELLAPLGATLATPRDPDRRGGHITVDHPAFPELIAVLWRDGVIPDFRRPDGIRLGLSPLSTSFAEVDAGVRRIAAELERMVA